MPRLWQILVETNQHKQRPDLGPVLTGFAGGNGWTTEDIRALVADVAAGRIKPVIDRTFPLAEARAAEELMEGRDLFGKVLLLP